MLDNFDLIVIEVGLLAFAGIIAFSFKRLYDSVDSLSKAVHTEMASKEELKEVKEDLIRYVDRLSKE